mgnify:CR=1 FL=1|tara:strand:+ start:832 stop:3180 length:2349 start_codon:yes stop_codon:yes gene_type:complete
MPRLAYAACVFPIIAWSSIGVETAGKVDRVFLEKHCYECHGDGSSKGELALDELGTDFSDAEIMRLWVLIHDRVASGEMPPKKKARPQPSEASPFLKSLAATLFEAHSKRREVVLRRLNRVEYENTIRDLLGVRVELKGLLPEEVSAHGFDNVGDALASSQALVKAYLDAADKAIDAAFGPDKEPLRIHLRIPMVEQVERQIGKLFRRTKDGVAVFNSGYCPTAVSKVCHKLRSPGTYRVRIQARAYQSDEPVTMSVHAGDVVVHRRPYHLVGYWDLPPGKMTEIEFTDHFERYDTFHPKPYGTVHHTRKGLTHPGAGIEFGEVEIEGPLDAWPPPSRVALLHGVDLAKGTLEDARAILERLLPKAFRREIRPQEVEPYLQLVQAALKEGRSFEEAIRLGLKGVLCSPEFLFLEEPSADETKTAELDGYSLASRLSYFLWSSMPDAALLEVAKSGQLNQPAQLRSQVERMLKDPRASAFTEHFTGQWLRLRDIAFTEPDKKLFPEYDEALKHGMLEETRRFFDRVLKENRSLLEFVDADWTILNARLASHYGIDGVAGSEFRVVDLPEDSVRGGVLTQASVLKVTANGTNTSPVTRGVWILSNLLDEPPPPPPPGIPAVEPDVRGTTTLREQLAKHRDVERCASCHRKIDPAGFALENFDVIGGWRTWYRSLGEGERVNRFRDKFANVRVSYRKGPEVDASGQTADGEPFQDVRAFKALLLKDSKRIARGVTRKLMVYATGRGLGFSDRPEIQRIVDSVAKQDYGFRSLVHEITQSKSFHRP